VTGRPTAAHPQPLALEGVRLGPGGGGEPVSLAVDPHHTVAFLGDENSGVGDLAGWALGLEAPRHGRVLVYGTDVRALPEGERLAFRRRVGYLPAGDGLLQNLSLRDNVALPLRFGSGDSTHAIDGRVGVMLAAVRVAGAADRRPAQVNEEERRRAAVARAIAFDPPLVLLEQPFDGLTARTAAELLEFVRGGETTAGGRRTVVITAQDLPGVIVRRIERVYRVSRPGVLEREVVHG
jgi:ABC-type transporter Mla maintaining outer membrane lipid asymmetry ATPase subunit MlaF